MVGFVTDLGDAACDAFDETSVGADAFRIEVARVGDRVDCAILLRNRECQRLVVPQRSLLPRKLVDRSHRFHSGKLTAHLGNALKLWAETNDARSAVATMVKESMANAGK